MKGPSTGLGTSLLEEFPDFNEKYMGRLSFLSFKKYQDISD